MSRRRHQREQRTHEAAPAPGSPPVKVLYVCPNATLGGAERVTMDLLALHDRRRVEPSVCFLTDGPLVQAAREIAGVQVFLVPAPSLKRYFAGRKAVNTIAGIASSSNVDLVHSVMAWGHIYGGRAAARAGKPAVWFQHVGAAWSSRIEAWAALVRARAIIANSEYTAAGQRRVNPRRVPIHVVHPGTRLPTEPATARRARGRRALKIRDGEFAVGIAARLSPAKGQEVVLRAAASLLHARAAARVFIIGDALFGLDTEWAATLPKLADELGISSRVTFTGFRDDVPDCLAAMDVALHASTTPESFGLGLVEAMAAGTALIAADNGAVREIVTPGTDALLTPPGDHEALATALLALCDNPGERIRLAVHGEQTARTRFDARTMTRRMEDLYREILAR